MESRSTQIFVQAPAGETITAIALGVELCNDTAEIAKQQIQRKGASADQLRLIFNEEQLEG